MRRRWGLQAKMTTSYVVVTATAVALVEAVLIAVALPSLAGAEEGRSFERDPLRLVETTAADYATRVSARTARLGRLPTAVDFRLGEAEVSLAPGEARPGPKGVLIPYTDVAFDDAAPMSAALLLDSAGVVVSSSYPAGFAVGRRFALPESPTPKGSGVAATSSGPVRWATAPVLDFGGLPEATSDPATVGTVYVQIPAGVTLIVPGTTPVDPSPGTVTGAFALFVLVLAGAVPVGVAFGLLSTRRLVRRVRRLAASTVAVAEGDLHHRVPVTGTDEVSQLEHHFNLMAERLSDAMHAERQLATAGERARIARELHDSISQDLFSLRLLAGGVRKALPTASPLRAQVATMEDTATGTMHEMQALLLHLRPVALAEVGLVAAIEEVCRAYRDRLGVTIDAEIEPVELPPPVEHAILRVVQEAIANAVRHARASRIALRLTHHDGRVEVLVEDDGVGFDPARTHERHGLGLSLMRERVAEVGGDLVLDSAPGEGTRVRVRL